MGVGWVIFRPTTLQGSLEITKDPLGEELMTLQPLSMIKSYNNSPPLHLKRFEKAER
jgi:hypothetical protein